MGRGMRAGPAVTILICTRNRVNDLRRSLPTVLRAAAASELDIEILVVDNGSTDSTGIYLSEVRASDKRIHVLVDDVPGLAGAHNRSLVEARGEVVLFTDDDVHVPLTWVDDMVSPILAGNAEAVAGCVELAPYIARPWLSARLRIALAELIDVSGPYPGMVGANMAVRAEVVRGLGFDEHLGAGAAGFADDVLLNLRLKHQRHRIVGCEGPPVTHHVDPSRLTYDAMVDLAFRNGRSHAYLWHHWLHSNIRIIGSRARWHDVRRVLHRRTRPAGGITESEYDAIYWAALFRHLAIERQSPPRYGSVL